MDVRIWANHTTNGGQLRYSWRVLVGCRLNVVQLHGGAVRSVSAHVMKRKTVY